MSDNNLGTYVDSSSLVLSIEEVLQSLKERFFRDLLQTKLLVSGVEISLSTTLTGNGGQRFWFVCPISGKRCRKLYIDLSTGAVGNRSVLGIPYASQVQKGMIEGDLRQQLKKVDISL